ncbi:MAG: hypothetical protein MRERC_16c016 [Mycoplasmataceae bacterium RC_NB112A]|nr:MAG: hypothetical protein MRERC_16c016 [Mycoplasmataceae bacterium RC_NB112A]
MRKFKKLKYFMVNKSLKNEYTEKRFSSILAFFNVKYKYGY